MSALLSKPIKLERAIELNFATLINKLQKVQPRVLLNSVICTSSFLVLVFKLLSRNEGGTIDGTSIWNWTLEYP